MPKFTVHLYATCKTEIEVDAATPEEAVEMAADSDPASTATWSVADSGEIEWDDPIVMDQDGNEVLPRS